MFDYIRQLVERRYAERAHAEATARLQQHRAFIEHGELNSRERDELNHLRKEKNDMLARKALEFDRRGGVKRDRTDLPTLRVNDLAGYLGRVNELLTLAGYATMPYEEDPEKTKKTAMSQHFLRAATQAASVQSDLLALIADREPEDTKWPADVMTAAMAVGKPPEAVNRIKPQCPICCDSVLLGGACPECGRSDVSDPFVNQRS